MKLKIKDIAIASGGPLIAVMNSKDAAMFDIHVMDRIKIKKGKIIETVVVDIAQSKKVVPKGRLGVFEEVIRSLNLKNNDIVDIAIARKPLSIDYIKKNTGFIQPDYRANEILGFLKELAVILIFIKDF